MSDWEQTALGDLISVKHGFAFAGSEFSTNSEMPILVTPGNFAIGGGFTHAKLKTFGGSVPAGYLLAARSVVVTMTDLSKQGDTLGYSAKIPKNGRYLHNQRIGLVATRVPAKLCIDYAYYLLQTPKYRQHILASATGSTVRHTSPSRIYDFKFDLPPLDEQRRIAEVLGALDDLIDTNERQIRGIRSLTTQLYKTALATSGEREVAFYEVFKVEFGGAFKGEHFTKSGVGMPLLRIRDFKRAVSDVWTTERLPGDTVVTAGDIVVGMDAEFRPNQWAGERSLLNQRVCRVSARNASNAFALEALEAPMAYIEGHKTGTTVIHLNKRDLEETRVTIPSEVAIREFDDVAEPLRVHSIGLSQENKTLRRTRDELLPLLMSGKVRVNPEGVSV